MRRIIIFQIWVGIWVCAISITRFILKLCSKRIYHCWDWNMPSGTLNVFNKEILFEISLVWEIDCACILSCVWFFYDPMDCSPPGFSVHGNFQARILEWVAITFSRGSSQLRDWTLVSCVFCISRWISFLSFFLFFFFFLTTEPPGKPKKFIMALLNEYFITSYILEALVILEGYLTWQMKQFIMILVLC